MNMENRFRGGNRYHHNGGEKMGKKKEFHLNTNLSQRRRGGKKYKRNLANFPPGGRASVD